MKKHPILYTFLIILCVIFLYIAFMIRDIIRVKSFIQQSSLSRSSRVRTIGIKGLCDNKNIDYDSDKQLLENNLNKLLADREKFLDFYVSRRGFTSFQIIFFPYLETVKGVSLKKVNYQEKEDDIEKFNELKKDIKAFDTCFNLKSIEDFNWNAFDLKHSNDKNPLFAIFILHSSDLTKLCTLIGFTEAFSSKNEEIADSSNMFNSILKIYMLSLYFNKGQILTNNNNHILDTIYVFHNNLINNKYSVNEMKRMLAIIKQALPLMPDYMENIKIQYEFSKNLYNFAFSEFPILANTVKYISEDPYPKLEELYTLFKEGKYEQGTDLAFKYQETISLMMISPDFCSFYDDHNEYIDIKSRLVLMQAVLENKLGLKITAIDPFDEKPIRSYQNDKGESIFYFLGHNGKDEKGTGDNIINCDTLLKKSITEE